MILGETKIEFHSAINQALLEERVSEPAVVTVRKSGAEGTLEQGGRGPGADGLGTPLVTWWLLCPPHAPAGTAGQLSLGDSPGAAL